jgi:predicted alpha/beta hydrolase family esterase
MTETAGQSALIIHGTDGHPLENWFPWLSIELRKKGFRADIPAFPTPEGHNLDNWLDAYYRTCPPINTYDVVVAHSLGAAFLLRLLELSNHGIKQGILVAGCIGKTGIRRYDILNESFLAKDFDWEVLSKKANKWITVFSDEDPYVSIDASNRLSSSLSAASCVVHSGGHLNSQAGYTEFPLLLNLVIGSSR